MTVSVPGSSAKVSLLAEDVASLARGIPPAQPGTLFVLGSNGGMRVAPDVEFPLLFGRNQPDVHVCVGAHDPHVSRQQGTITRQHSRWVLHNIGKLPIRLPGSRLVLGDDHTELAVGYTPLFIVGPHEEHLLEVRIAAHTPTPGHDGAHEAETRDGSVWPLTAAERLVLVCLSRRYLEREPLPQPMAWSQVADELSGLRPDEHWTWRRAAHIVANVRKRLSASVPGLLEEDVPPPVGNALNHNLIVELLVSTTITRADLRLLEPSSG